MHMAVAGGHSTVCEWLLECGAEDSRNRQGQTGYQMAQAMGHVIIVDLLDPDADVPSSMELDLRSPQAADQCGGSDSEEESDSEEDEDED